VERDKMIDKVMSDRLFKALFYRIFTFSKAGLTNMEIVGILESLKQYYINKSCLDYLDVELKSKIRYAMKRKYKLVEDES
jgi:hypothetical protein